MSGAAKYVVIGAIYDMSGAAKHVVIVHCHQGQLSDKLTNRNLNSKKQNIYIDIQRFATHTRVKSAVLLSMSSSEPHTTPLHNLLSARNSYLLCRSIAVCVCHHKTL